MKNKELHEDNNEIKSSYTIEILKDLLEGKTFISSDKHYVNANQYANNIKNNGIELIEVWRPNKNGRGQHKERRLHQTIENIKRAENYLKSLQGVRV